MTPISSNVTSGTSLSVSVSGTAYLQRSIAAGVKPGVLAPTKDERTAASGRETASQALSKVSSSTRDAIEQALKAVDANASLDNYADGKGWSNGSGLILHLIA
jgi:hypothetical protein